MPDEKKAPVKKAPVAGAEERKALLERIDVLAGHVKTCQPRKLARINKGLDSLLKPLRA